MITIDYPVVTIINEHSVTDHTSVPAQRRASRVAASRPWTAITAVGAVALAGGALAQPRHVDRQDLATSNAQVKDVDPGSLRPTNLLGDIYAGAEIKNFAAQQIRPSTSGSAVRRVFSTPDDNQVLGLEIDFKEGLVSAFDSSDTPLSGRLQVRQMNKGISIRAQSAPSAPLGGYIHVEEIESGQRISGSLQRHQYASSDVSAPMVAKVQLVNYSEQLPANPFSCGDDGSQATGWAQATGNGLCEEIRSRTQDAINAGGEAAEDAVGAIGRGAETCAKDFLAGAAGAVAADKGKSIWDRARDFGRSAASRVGLGGAAGSCAYELRPQ